ncbi:hypothetical protein EZS27_014569 [termite gut metagenome]|uniref:Uncharacterized protein n=1 Tax=termite gut metagenome TaxID=433724 RepID=A0A5J4RWG0_9ZZZZ
MKYLLSLIFPIALLISCQKEDRAFETANKLISFSPNFSQTDTRATDDYSLSDYFNACPTATVRMIIGNEVKTAKYIYKAETKTLEYADRIPLYYPEDNSPYQLIISWPDETLLEEVNDYQNQDNKESFFRSDLLSDTINNAVAVDYLPVFFKHLRSKITFILSEQWETYTINELTVNGRKSFHDITNPNVGKNTYQMIYDLWVEEENSKGLIVAINKEGDKRIEHPFLFDVSDLKVGENRKIFIPFLYEFE